MTLIPEPTDLCPCGSGTHSQDCCLAGGLWLKIPRYSYKAQQKNYSRYKCYLNTTNDCSTKISKEHFISRNILEKITLGESLKVKGLPWANNLEKILTPEQLTSKVLCTYHNNLLSPLDAEAGSFFEIADSIYKNSNQSSSFNIVCGEDLELWLLKTLLSVLASNHRSHKPNPNLIDLLCQKTYFKGGSGLYIRREDNTNLFNSAQAIIRFSTTGDITNFEFRAYGIPFVLVLDDSSLPKDLVFKPRRLSFESDNHRNLTELTWISHQATDELKYIYEKHESGKPPGY